MKRIIALILVLCFVLTALMACGGEEAPTDAADASGAGTENGSAGDDGGTLEGTNEWGDPELIHTIVPEEHDYGGEMLTMLVRDADCTKREFGHEQSAEEVSEQIRTKNSVVANDLNIVFVPEYISTTNYDDCVKKFTERIQTDTDGDQHTIDIVAHYAYAAGIVSIRERSANLLDKDTFPYFDFTLPCWNQTIAKNSTINGKSLVCAGDMTLSLFNYASIMWHNKTLYSKLRDPNEDPEDMQDCVLAGEWTSDKLYKWASKYENSSAADDCDTYGIYLEGTTGTQVDVLPSAWNLNLMTTNADGTHAFNILGNEAAEEAVVLFRDMTSKQGNAHKHTTGNGVGCKTGNCFIAGNVVFQFATLSPSATESEKLRGMEDTYALLPFPKFDELQAGRQLTDIEKKLGVEDMGYYSTSQDCYTLLGALDHFESTVTTKGEMISAYLQHSAELSYADVRGYYFEKVIRGKNLGIDDSDGTVSKSIRIFNMIVNNLKFEYWNLYSASLGDVMWLFRDTTIYSEDTLEKAFKANEKEYTDAIKATDSWFGLIDAD